jgi:predicted Rossmann-fold nucleotide-binding protein
MMPVRRVAVTGGRDHKITPEEERAFREALYLQGIFGRVIVLHGNCRGVDQAAAKLAEKWAYPTVPFVAPWDYMEGFANNRFADKPHYRKIVRAIAGPLRNWMMVEAAHVLIAFPGGRGTADCIRQAEKKGIKVVRMEGYYSSASPSSRPSPARRSPAASER